MKTLHFLTFALGMSCAAAAEADQFAVRTDKAFESANAQLMATLRIGKVESFSLDGAHYVVLEAPGEAWVETFFGAIAQNALELRKLDAEWNRPAMAGLTLPQRMGFSTPLDCSFCGS